MLGASCLVYRHTHTHTLFNIRTSAFSCQKCVCDINGLSWDLIIPKPLHTCVNIAAVRWECFMVGRLVAVCVCVCMCVPHPAGIWHLLLANKEANRSTSINRCMHRHTVANEIQAMNVFSRLCNILCICSFFKRWIIGRSCLILMIEERESCRHRMYNHMLYFVNTCLRVCVCLFSRVHYGWRLGDTPACIERDANEPCLAVLFV